MSDDITRPQGDSQLTIPEEAVTLAVQAVDYAATDETTETISVALEAAAPLIVAAYLDEMAEMWLPSPGMPPIPHDYLIKRLRERAAELRGGAQ